MLKEVSEVDIRNKMKYRMKCRGKENLKESSETKLSRTNKRKRMVQKEYKKGWNEFWTYAENCEKYVEIFHTLFPQRKRFTFETVSGSN